MLHIVTVATESKYYFPYLVKSCRRNGKKLEILGFGQPWRGFNQRNQMMIEYLEQLPVEDLVCFVDGYDVLCIRPLEDMVSIFHEIQKRTGCKMVVAEDKGRDTMGDMFFGRCQKQAINSGMYIGKAKDLLHIIKTIFLKNSNPKYDDQYLLTAYCKRNPSVIYVDNNSVLFLSLHAPLQPIDHFLTVNQGTIMYQDVRPFFIHAPGYGFLDNVVIRLGYDKECHVKDELKRDHFKKKILHYGETVWKNVGWILVVLIVIVSGYMLLYRKRKV